MDGGRKFKCYVKGDAIGREDGIVTEDLEEKFAEFGKVENVWVGKMPSGFAFVTYFEERDRDDAIEKMDGQDFKGCRLIVEPAKEKEKREVKPGDWACPTCRINNFAKREECFRCQTRKPFDHHRFERRGGGGGRGYGGGRPRSRDRSGRQGGRFRSRDRRDSYRRDDYRGDRGNDYRGDRGGDYRGGDHRGGDRDERGGGENRGRDREYRPAPRRGRSRSN